MNKILALREKRANLWNETKAFLGSHRGEDGMVSAYDNATYEKMEADVVAPGKEIERLERQAAIDREMDQPLQLRWFPVLLRLPTRNRAVLPMSTGTLSGA